MRCLLLVRYVPAKPCSTLPMFTIHFISCLLLSLAFESSSVAKHILNITAAGSSGILFCNELAMERLFSPCPRYQDLLKSRDGLEKIRYHRELSQELNLDVSTEELLSAERAFTYADLYTVLVNPNKVLWLTLHTAVVRTDGFVNSYSEFVRDDYKFTWNVDCKAISALASSSEELLEICDVVLRLLAVSVVHSVEMSPWNSPDDASINTTSLAYLMEHCQSLAALTLEKITLDEDHFRALGDFSKPGLEIILVRCKITWAGASALAEVLGRTGPDPA
jgi:hypothetical protein